MKRKRSLTVAGLLLLAIAAVFAYRFRDLISIPRTYAEPVALTSVTAEQANWENYGRDAGGSRWSPLTQIHRNNVGQLKVAWTYHTGEARLKPQSRRDTSALSKRVAPGRAAKWC